MEMTKKILLLIVLGCLFGHEVNAQKIEWRTIEQAAKTDSKSNTKLYFVDFYTSWCGWCKKMDKETFTDPTVSLILNHYYIPVKFDAEGKSEFTWHGNNFSSSRATTSARATTHTFAKQMLGNQMGFPSFGIFSSDQSRITILQGYQNANDLIIVLWYFASGDYKHYAFDKYSQIFDKEIRPTMNAKLGIK